MGIDTSRVSLLENISDDAIYYAVYSAILCTTYNYVDASTPKLGEWAERWDSREVWGWTHLHSCQNRLSKQSFLTNTFNYPVTLVLDFLAFCLVG